MNSRNVKDQLEEIAGVVDVTKPCTDEAFTSLSAKLQCFRPKAFEDRIADIRHVKDGITSELAVRLLTECERATQAAVSQYQQQLYYLFQSFYDEFKELRELGKGASQLSNDFDSLPTGSKLQLLDEFSEAVDFFRESLTVGRLNQDEVCDSFVLIASELFEGILPIDNTAAHVETARDVAWTTLSTFTTLGLLEYAKVVRRANPTERRNLELKTADQSLIFYEAYYKAIKDWDQTSKAWQLRVEMGLK